jgi:hypothetical protein
MFVTSDCTLDVLIDDAMYTIIHENLRGGVAIMSKRRGQANN